MGQACSCQTSSTVETTQNFESQKSLSSDLPQNKAISHASKPQGISERPQQRLLSEQEEDVDVSDEAKNYTHRASFLLKLFQNEKNGDLRIEFSQSASPRRRQQNQQFYEMIIKYQSEMQSYQKRLNKKTHKEKKERRERRERKEKNTIRSCSPRKGSRYQHKESNSQVEQVNVLNQFNCYIMNQQPAWVSPTRKRKVKRDLNTLIVKPQQRAFCDEQSQVESQERRNFSSYHKNYHTTYQAQQQKIGILKNQRSYSGYHKSEGSFNSTRKKKVHFSGFYPKQE